MGKDVESCRGPNLNCYLGICLERLRKITKNVSQDSRSPGLGSNPGPPEYEAGVNFGQYRYPDLKQDSVPRSNFLTGLKSIHIIS
jgi:hypothetical protein